MTVDGSPERRLQREPDRLTLDVLEGNIQLLAEKERLEHERQKLEQRDRARNEFLARVSADLRTPLNGILGFTELLLAEAPAERRHRDYLQAIHRNGHSLLALINDLLEVASLEAGQIAIRAEPVPLATVLDDLRAATAAQFADGAVAVEWPQREALDGVTALLDRRRICQALVAVVEHARRHTPPGGRVGVVFADGPEATVFAVEDSGPGVPVEDRARVFAPSFIRDPSGPRGSAGVGLGLAIARGIIERHGGRIELVDREGRGARFTLVIPRRPPS